MRTRSILHKAAVLVASGLMTAPGALAQAQTPVGATTAPRPTQPAWPRTYSIGAAQLSLYQPQTVSWDGTTLTGRAAFTLGVAKAAPNYGVVSFSAQTPPAAGASTVSLSGIRIDRVEIPLAPDQEAAVTATLGAQLARQSLSLPLPLVQANIAAGVSQTVAQISTTPPKIVFADQLTVLIPVAGAPVLKPVAGASGFQRVINTPALLLLDVAQTYHLQAGGAWYEATALDGPWFVTAQVPADVSAAAKAANATQPADPLLPQDGKPISPPPAILVSTVPTELIQTDGPSRLGPVEGTHLQTIENADHAVFFDSWDSSYYVLISGRWFRSTALAGPWAYVANTDLPGQFAKIAPTDPKANVLISVAGTPQAKAAASCREHSADRSGAGNRDRHGDLSGPAAVRAGGRHGALLCGERERARDLGRVRSELHGLERGLVHGPGSNRPLDRGAGGATRDLHHPPVLPGALSHRRADLWGNAEHRHHRVHPGLYGGPSRAFRNGGLWHRLHL